MMQNHVNLVVCIFLILQLPSLSMMMMPSTSLTPKIVTISEAVWRSAASKHSQHIKSLLQPGLTPLNHQINAGSRRRNYRQPIDDWTAVDPINPIYNFLIEYYGLKGAKGPRRLSRWSPNPSLLLLADDYCIKSDCDDTNNSSIQSTIQTISTPKDSDVYQAAMEASHGLGGILLENASQDDLGGTLNLRGSAMVLPEESGSCYGILYNPGIFYNRHIPIPQDDIEAQQQLLKTKAPYQWYTSILQTTLDSDPILHCYGLHEWAMQYHPEGADPPPSAKYQSSLKLRVSRETINDTVERKGVRCTHVDALRFFAPAAGPLNHHGATLERMDQLRLEQKGCVHAHMDLLKIGLKLQPFIDSELLVDILEVALQARKLDVEASPYDATSYGASVVPIETNEGRKMYREQQIALMLKAEPVRQRLLEAYNVFMKLAFDEDALDDDSIDTAQSTKVDAHYVAPERLSRASPGSKPWRKNLVER